jgi:hypothetical protein
MPSNSPRAGAEGSNDPLDLLIEQEHKLFETDDQRQGAADGRTAVILTAALTLTGLSLTAWDDVAGASREGKIGFAVVAMIAGALALLRSGSGYFHSEKTWFSSHSKHTSAALRQLRLRETELVPGLASRGSDPGTRRSFADSGGKQTDPLTERQLALAVWRNRAIDARERAKRKERASALAALLLAMVLIVFGVAVVVDALF